jgi:hypothetical protein
VAAVQLWQRAAPVDENNHIFERPKRQIGLNGILSLGGQYQ